MGAVWLKEGDQRALFDVASGRFSRWQRKPVTYRSGSWFRQKRGANQGNAGLASELLHRLAVLSGPRAKEALSTGWDARLCCKQRGRLAAVFSQFRGVRQRVQAVGSARECAREREPREKRSGSQSSSVCVCGHSPSWGAIARVLGPTQWSSMGGCCSRPRTNAEKFWCKCSRPMGQRTFGVRMRVSRQRPRRERTLALDP